MKKIVTVLAAAVMAFALPTAAFAVDSPTEVPPAVVETADGNQIVASADNKGYVTAIDASKVQASNVPAGVTADASFVVVGEVPEGESTTLTFTVGTQYNGRIVEVYIEHSDGTEEKKECTVVDGVITVTVDRLSVFSLVITDRYAETGTADSSAKSPSTSASLVAVAGLTAASTLGAGAVAVTLRKKDAE